MSRLGFIHRRLWAEDGWYRAAFVFGPAALLGAALAGAAWGGWQLARTRPQAAPPAWAVPEQAAPTWQAGGEAQALAPARPLPARGADGALAGFEPGWRVTAHEVALLPTLDADVKPAALAAFPLQGATIDMAGIVASGPASAPLRTAVGAGALAIRTAGIYAVTLRFERPEAVAANCLVRLALGPRRIVANYFVGLSQPVARTFPAPRFALEPGLYPLNWAFGCWQDQHLAGPGRITIMIAHPGETDPVAARADDILRPRNP